MLQCDQYLRNMETFHGLYRYMQRLSRTLFFADYVSEVSEDFLGHEKSLGTTAVPTCTVTSTAQSAAEYITIPKRKLIKLFNTTKGTWHRLYTHGHFPAPSRGKTGVYYVERITCLIEAKGAPPSTSVRSAPYFCASAYQQISQRIYGTCVTAHSSSS